MTEATRVTFGKTIVKLGEYNENIVVLEADLGKSTNSFRFQESYPSRYFQMGIAEANMIGTAAGLALSGKIPFICSFACFVTGRYDIIRVSVALSCANVKIIGTHSGISAGEDGASQQGLEDISLMRSLPGMVVLQPADDIEAQQMFEYAVSYKGPMYIRLTRQKVPRVHPEKYSFDPNKINILKTGDDVAFFVTGGTASNALHAAEQLEQYDISVAVLNVHTIKPIDRETILHWAQTVKYFITIEDHNIIGGLGTTVAEVLSEYSHNNTFLILKRLGVDDCFGESGSSEDLCNKYNLSINKIVEITRKLYSL